MFKKSYVSLFAVLILLIAGTRVEAANRTASSSGNWNSTATWGGSSVPTAADAVTINSGITVTVNIVNAQCATLTFANLSTTSNLTVSGTNTLTVTGLIYMPRPSNNSASCNLNVNAGTINCGSLTMNATNSGRNDNINITSGTLTVTGTLSTGATGCNLNLTGSGTLNMGNLDGTPNLNTVTGCSVNYTGTTAQTIYGVDYNGNLGVSGSGTKTLATSLTVYGNLSVGISTLLSISSTVAASINGNITNSGSIYMSAGTSSNDTWLRMGGNVTNNPGATITATENDTRFLFISAIAQTFTNNGTVTPPVASFGVANTHASGLTMAGTNNVVIARANLFYGTVFNSGKLTLGNGGSSGAVIQRGMSGNTSAAGSFNAAPVFNTGTGELSIYYDNGSVAYTTGFEIPASRIVDNVSFYDAADVTLNGNLTITTNLNFAGGTGTPAMRIAANTLTLNGALTYTVDPVFMGGTSSNLVLNTITTLKGVTNGLNNFTVNGNTTLAGAVTVNGILTLTNGVLVNDSYLTMASGATISRSQGSLWLAPTFAGTINLVYTGSSAITSGVETPVAPAVLNNLTTNTGGVIQGGTPSSPISILTEDFSSLSNWQGDIGTSGNQFRSMSSSNAGGSANECRYIWGTSWNTYYTGSIYRSVNTTGYTSLNISWKQFIDNYNVVSYPFTLKVQCATSTSGPWTDIYSLTPTVTTNIGPETQTFNNWTTNVGGTFYIRYYITGYTYGINYWYIDDLEIVAQPPLSSSIVTVNGTLDLSSGPYSIASNTLALAGGISGSNTITGTSSSNLSVSGSGSNLTIPSVSGVLNNFTINRANGVTLGGNVTVNGILNLQSANPTASQGTVHTGSNTLSMGGSATTVGAGDVTGIVSRTALSPNIQYTFGNQFTTISFSAVGTVPAELKAKISIGTSPAWKPAAIKRVYDFVQTGGSECVATIRTHYQDSELNGLDENSLSQWTYGTPGPPAGLFEWGSSNRNTTENWVEIANIDISNFPTTFGQLENTLGTTDVVGYQWNGSVSTVWTNASNWTPAGIPSSISEVLIPDATTTTFSPSIPATTELKSITIAVNGVVNAVAGAQLTINGGNGAWSNIGGTFNPGTSTVIFTNVAATLSGTTNFNNVTIASGKELWMTSGSTMRIAGTMNNMGIWKTVIGGQTTVEYNGGSQTILNPNGPTTGYHHLVLSGSGTKTMPATSLNIAGNFTLSGTVSATVGQSITVAGNITVGTGTTLGLGAFSHSVGGNITNSGGTFNSSSSSITLNGSSAQTITSTAAVAFANFTITNTGGTLSLGGSTNCSISGNFTTVAGSVFDLLTNRITAITGTVSHSGTIITQSTSATPVPSGKNWGGTFTYAGAAAQTVVSGTYNNFTISSTGGVTAVANITVNGILSLLPANPSATKGILEMSTFTLLMGPASTTIGTGDVTGIVKRTTILPNVTYTMGHQFTSIMFPAVGTLPTELSLKLKIGSAPTWKPGAINRVYDLIQSGGTGTQAILYAHYLDSELNGNAENAIVDWVYVVPATMLIEYGRSDYNTDDNWVAISNVNVGVFSSVFGIWEVTMDESETLALRWNGSTSTSWVTASNWTPNGAPSDHTAITIPDAATTNFDLTIPVIATCGTITFESGAIVNATANAQLTLNDETGTWNNQGGTFNPGNSNIIFTHANASIDGSTDFYNLTINSGAGLSLESSTYIGISGEITNNGIIYAVEKGTTTIEYKGADQTVIVPNPATNRYSNLVLSGSGTKNMPVTPLAVHADFTASGPITVVSGSSLTVHGHVNIGNGTAFNAGAFSHAFNGNFTNNGSFTAPSGSTVTMNGLAAQSMGGASVTTFNNLTINNSFGVSLSTDININSLLSLSSGNMNPGTTTLGINGNISKTTGFINAVTGSSFSFGGTSAITLPNNLFATPPTINNLVINNPAGITTGNQDIAVEGLLNLAAGTLNLSAIEFTIVNNVSRTAGTINASNSGATLTFTNSSPLTLPVGIFSAAVNNLDLDGVGGITVPSDFTINGELDLDHTNPTATKGCIDMWDGSSMKILTMGPNSSTIGAGDVTGIIRRTTINPEVLYTFGSELMTAYFPDEGTIPSEMSIKVTIGNAPSWRAGAIQRYVEIIQTGGMNTKAVLTMRYLDSELNGNDENNLVLWVGPPYNIEYGRSAYNTSDNWVTLSNINMGFFSGSFDGTKNITLDEYGTTTTLTWNGSVSSSWTTVDNWTPNEGPSSFKRIVIPDASTTPNDPILPLIADIKSLVLHSGAILNSNTDAQLTINGGSDAWSNSGGTFNAENSEVIFVSAAATISGSTNFFDVTLNAGSELWMTGGSTMRIAGSITNNGIWHTVTGGITTVEYNGGNQTIVKPNPTTSRYSNLILSGSGTKTFQAGAMSINGDFEIAGTATTTLIASISFRGNFDIRAGATLITGSFSHIIGGNFSNEGTFTSTGGNTFTFNGSSSQLIEGSTATVFNNLTIDNASGVQLTMTAVTTVSGDLTINSGKKFIVNSGRMLTVEGTITNNAGSGGFVLKSDTSGTASLLHNSASVTATVERYFNGLAEAWHFISAPVANQDISGPWLPSGTYGNGTGYDMYMWHEPTNCWIYKLNTTATVNWNTVHPASNFAAARGYLYAAQASSPTKEFAGNLNNGSNSIALSYSSAVDSLKGFNLAGNPYPSPIDWQSAAGWSRSDLAISGSGYDMWIWNQSTNNYGVCNSASGSTGTNGVSRYIAPMQGFFVKASTTGNLSMDNSVRLHENSAVWLKNSDVSFQHVSLKVKSNEGFGSDEILLGFGGSENAKGAMKLFSQVATAPSLFMSSGSENYSVLYFTDTQENPAVPVKFKPGADGTYLFSCNFDPEQFDIVMLEDRQTNYIQDMKAKQTYAFVASINDDHDRFVMHFGAEKNPVNKELPARIFSGNNNLMIDLTLIQNETSLMVYDLLGRRLLQKQLKGGMQHSISFSAGPQILVIYLQNSNGNLSRKIYWKGN